MKFSVHPSFAKLHGIEDAAAAIRSCVHCGFCNATCPTYQELHDERDGPRGRIYLVKNLLESGRATAETQLHLDRCLTCRSCETTCPSGVQYGKLLDVGRGLIDKVAPRGPGDRLKRWLLRKVLPHPIRFAFLLKLGQWLGPVLPISMKKKVPPRQTRIRVNVPTKLSTRNMILLTGCVQDAATPNTNVTAKRVVSQLNISLSEARNSGCCGAVSYHLGDHREGQAFARRNIDAWWPEIKAGAEAVVTTASGCGAMVKDYGHILRDCPDYKDKAKTVSEMTKDLAEVIAGEDIARLHFNQCGPTAVHSPCTQTHGQRIGGAVEEILIKAGVPVVRVEEQHLCCGSAGTYSLLQPELSEKLLRRKVAALTISDPEQIVTANVGCQLHIGAASSVPVQHWIELLDI